MKDKKSGFIYDSRIVGIVPKVVRKLLSQSAMDALPKRQLKSINKCPVGKNTRNSSAFK
jgi:hypothetical protein